MKIPSIHRYQNFKGVYALIGTREQIREATASLVSAKGESLTLPASSLYRNDNINSPYNQYIKEGKSISFVVTGKDTRNISALAAGWKTLEEISKQIDKCIILKDIKQQMKEVRKSMSK